MTDDSSRLTDLEKQLSDQAERINRLETEIARLSVQLYLKRPGYDRDTIGYLERQARG